jgi:Putative prokaryotic signal transducing protein
MADLVRVAVVDNEPEAELAVSVLAGEDIRAMWRTTNAAAAGLGAGTGSALGPLEILVWAEDAERARELLA